MNLKRLLIIIKTIYSNGFLPFGTTYIMKGSDLTLYGRKYDCDLYKIGRSVEPEKRLYNLKHSLKKFNCLIEDVEIIATFPYNIETELQDEFKNEKVVGEWFKYTKDLAKLILLFKFYNNWKFKILEIINSFPEDDKIIWKQIYNGEFKNFSMDSHW